MAGLFITLEGLDGAGKSSHVEWIAARLRAQGRDVIVTREPGGTPLGEKIRALVLHEPMDILSETLLVFAARQEHLRKLILPQLAAGNCVLSDRFTDATYAYQGAGRGLDHATIETMERWVQRDLQPDLTLFFDVAPELAQQRRRAAGSALDRFEREEVEFHRRVRESYLARAAQSPARFRVIDGALSFSEVRKQLEEVLTT